MSRVSELEADVAFLILRAGCAGTAYFGEDRWTGISSNAIVSVAYGGMQDALPHDRGDYAACVRTYWRLPRHRKTEAVREALRKAREAYLDRCPDERFPGPRKAARVARAEAWAAYRKRYQRRKRRRA